VKLADEAVPEEGTLPVPDQPIQTYWMPEPPGVGEVTESFIPMPESNQPLTGLGESYEEVTVK
jgi:hypothetical protein